MHNERPLTRGDCARVERPCPWVSCRYHIGIDVNPQNGVVIEHAGWENRYTCSLDLAEHGGLTAQEIAAVYEQSRQRIDEIVACACAKLRALLCDSIEEMV